MRNLTTFPIERLCFDLKVEVLEQLEAKDVVELVKVNKGFQWMISNRPSIVFGHHVDVIGFRFEALKFKKLNSESHGVSLDVIRDLTFIKSIRSCDLLWMSKYYDSPIDKDRAAFLKQLEAVNSLDLIGCSPVGLDLLSHLSSKVKEYAGLPSFLQKTPSIKDLVGHFIEAQLNECEIVRVPCLNDDEFQFYYNAFVKTHIKYVLMRCYNADIILPAFQRIVSHGIPSKSPTAVVIVYGKILFYDDMKATIVTFLTGYPGMRIISRKNRRPFIALANDHWKGSRRYAFTMKSLFCPRNIDATRGCIYMLSLRKFDAESTRINFFAFYIEPDEMIDH